MIRGNQSSVKKTIQKTAFLSAIVFGIIFLHYTKILSPVENVALRLLSPFQAFAFEASGENTNQSSEELSGLSKEDLVKKNLELQDTVNNLKIENVHLQTVAEEAKLTAEQLNFLKKKSYTAQTAKVITRSTEGFSLSININKGYSDGIQKGYPVITDEGILIGIVEDTTDTTSHVRLITSADALTSGSVQNEKKSPGIVRGSHNLAMKMDFIPQNDAIAVGEMVTTSGTDPFIPRGLVLGEIRSVQTAEGSVFQEAQIQPLFSIENTFIVSVIIP